MAKKETIHFSIRISPIVNDWLKERAFKKNRSRNNLINLILSQAYAESKRKDQCKCQKKVKNIKN